MTIPKFPTPASQPPKRSGFSSSLALTNSPSAVTTSTLTELVDRQAVLALEPADPTAEGEAREPGVGDDPGWNGESERLRLSVQVAEQDPGLGPCCARCGVHANPFHRPEVDDHPPVAHAQARVAVTAAAHRYELVVLSSEANCGDDVGDTGTAGDQRRAAVDRGVPDPSLLVVGRIIRADQGTPERRRKLIDRAAVELDAAWHRAHECPRRPKVPQYLTAF